MRTFRFLVVLLLLVAVPFQAAIGASGFQCVAGSHHVGIAGKASPHHEQAGMAAHHHAVAAVQLQPGDGPVVAHQHVSVDPVTPDFDSQDASGKCKVCSECCSAAAPVPASPLSLVLRDSPLRVSSTVDGGMTSPASGGLFRPPRTSAV